eukprot:GILK01010119.1.p1 GENE.GILK01010119.1~~GILK01010119.1.p1  ORF type:complete len:318 (-),score=28.63 GILK01010119.1:65-1018(-)
MKSNDSLDKRSGLIRSGALTFTNDRLVDRRCTAVRQGDVLVTASGAVDGRSAAVRSEELFVRPSHEEGASDRRAFSSAEKENAWQKADPIPGCNPDVYRKDKMGNRMHFGSYGKNTSVGWHMDHSKPLASGGTSHPNNLHALQAAQNHSKGGKYPYDYQSSERKGDPPVPVTVDLRTSLVRSGALTFKPDGTVDGKCSAVKTGIVLVKTSGEVDRRSSGYRSGEVKLKPSVEAEVAHLASRVQALAVIPSASHTSSPARDALSSGSSSESSDRGSAASTRSSSLSHNSASASSSRETFTGPRGGTYHFTSSGKKSYK